MNRKTMLRRIALAVPVVLAAASASQAVVILGPNGSGGYNAYELVNTPTNYAGAVSGSQVSFPGIPSLNVSGSPAIIGHLASFASAEDFYFLGGLRQHSTGGDTYIGLTDSNTFAPVAFEDGNNSGDPLPANGAVASSTQRGAGWAWVDSNTLNTFHQKLPGVSIWAGGEPNNAGDEDAASFRGDRLLNDLPVGFNQPYIREWDLNLSADQLPGFIVRDIRNTASTPNHGNYVNLARNPDGNPNIMETVSPVINYGDAGGDDQYGGGEPFPQGGGDNFLIRATGYVKIPTTGIYTITGAHDDPLFVNIGTTYGSAGIDEQNCCGSNPRQVYLTAGVYPIEVIMSEFGGGEHVEVGIGFGTLGNGDPGLALIGAPGHPAGVMVHQDADALGGLTALSASASVPQGWMVTVQNAANTPGFDNFPGGNNNGEVNNITEGIQLINVGGPAEAMVVSNVINFTDNNFPAGTSEEHFALYAKGYADVLHESGMLDGAFYVNSDDGFRLLVNGEVVSEFTGPTGSSNTLSNLLTLKDNDFIELYFFEQGGGEFVTLQFDADGSGSTTGDRQLVGNPLSGIIIRQAPTVPEPASAMLGVMGAAMLGLRRRRTA